MSGSGLGCYPVAGIALAVLVIGCAKREDPRLEAASRSVGTTAATHGDAVTCPTGDLNGCHDLALHLARGGRRQKGRDDCIGALA